MDDGRGAGRCFRAWSKRTPSSPHSTSTCKGALFHLASTPRMGILTELTTSPEADEFCTRYTRFVLGRWRMTRRSAV
jgi:hypothetical protein